MKKLLLLLTVFGGFLSANAQGGTTCATAQTITANGTVQCATITGTYIGTCAPNGAPTAPKAMWFKYTPTVNGEMTLDSDLPQNFGRDTRLSILTGTCTALQCWDGKDDNDPSTGVENYLTTLTVPVQAGTTYYISWDNRWETNAFDFNFTFTAVSCIRPHATQLSNPTSVTTTSATLNWGAALGSPSGYDVQHGAPGFVLGAGTVVNTATTSATITGAANSIKNYYYRSNCGASQSAWVGPFSLYYAASLPFAANFEVGTTADTFGFTSTTWGLGNAANGAQSGTLYYFVNSTTTAVTNAALYSRAIALQAGEQVTLTFYTRLGVATGSNHLLRVKVNNSLSTTGATQVGADIAVTGDTYTMQTRTFTASTAGTYYFIFHNETPVVTAATSLRLDTVNMTSVLNTNEFLASNLTVYPNPAKNVINISNALNATVDTVIMTDLNGRVVKNIKVNATEAQVSISDLAAGIYMMNISTDQGSVTKKIIKE